jgi:hypothetical protein
MCFVDGTGIGFVPDDELRMPVLCFIRRRQNALKARRTAPDHATVPWDETTGLAPTAGHGGDRPPSWRGVQGKLAQRLFKPFQEPDQLLPNVKRSQSAMLFEVAD